MRRSSATLTENAEALLGEVHEFLVLSEDRVRVLSWEGDEDDGRFAYPFPIV